MSDLFAQAYNPDVLSCLANLSNDEVFTPPEIANQMLDMLPEEIWSDPNVTFLDPATKSGVFLREIAKRLLEARMPGYEVIMKEINKKVSKGEKLSQSEQEYVDKLNAVLEHIFKKQVFGIATTELCSLLSRRSLYCSKYPNCDYAIVKFDDPEGNIRYRRKEHEWVNGRCKYCGASQENYDRGDELESYAYEFIHFDDVEEELPMKFDVIIGNPPYQLSDGGNKASASPIYHRFIEQAVKLNPRFLAMIVPSRYLSGGKGLDKFRAQMLSDRRLVKMVDFINAKDCFPQNSIGGGVNYFLWDRDNKADCEVTTVLSGGQRETLKRDLAEFSSFVRYNQAVSIIRKIKRRDNSSIENMVSSRNPFGLPTSERGHKREKPGDYRLISSKGASFIEPSSIEKGEDLVDKYKVLISRITYEHAGEPDKEGKLRVLSKIKVLEPTEVCTDSYLVIGDFCTREEANNFSDYLKSKFVRFLVSQALTSINLSKDKFSFVPNQDFKKPVDIKNLYVKYELSDDEISFIETLIHDFPLDGDA